MNTADKLVAPPRRVPFTTALSLHFGGSLTVLSWIFVAFGMLFVMAFGWNVNFTEPFKFRGQLQTAQAVITDAYETNMSVNEEPVVQWFYRYEVDGQTYDGNSYSHGRWHDQGEKVIVEFPPGSPERARIVGGRLGQSPLWVFVFVTTFPVVGLVGAFFGLRSGHRAYRLLRNGVLTRGSLRSKVPTAMTVNDAPVYEMTFAFSPQGFPREFTCVAKAHDTHALEDESTERILYLPNDPTVAVLLDSLPEGVRIAGDGQFVGTSPLIAVALGCSPALAAALGGIFLWRLLLS